MIVVYKKDTGGIIQAIDNEVVSDSFRAGLDENTEAMSTLVEHKNNILTMRVDLTTKRLVEKSAILLSADKLEITAGDSILLDIAHDGERFGETFLLSAGNKQVIQVPYELSSIQITFDLPGQYLLHVPDLRIYSNKIRIDVKDDVQ